MGLMASKKCKETHRLKILENSMSKEKKEFKPGDHVEWSSIRGKTQGKVKDKITQEKKISKHKVRASSESPQYEVASDSTGKHAAHKPETLKKIGK